MKIYLKNLIKSEESEEERLRKPIVLNIPKTEQISDELRSEPHGRANHYDHEEDKLQE